MAHPLIEVFSRNIQVRMTEASITTAQAAQALNLTLATFRNIRAGRIHTLNPDTLVGLTQLFNCTISDLLDPQPNTYYRLTIDDALSSPQDQSST